MFRRAGVVHLYLGGVAACPWKAGTLAYSLDMYVDRFYIAWWNKPDTPRVVYHPGWLHAKLTAPLPG